MTVYNQAVYNSLWGFERNGDVTPIIGWSCLNASDAAR